MGRLAIQLKMLTPAEVEGAIAESVSSGNPRLAQVFLQMGLLDREQVKKLQQVQKDLIEKHRAKKEAAAARTGATAPQAPASGPSSASGSTPSSAAPASPSPAASARSEAPEAAVHAAAEHAAAAAAPMTSRDVDALREAPAAPASGPGTTVGAAASTAPATESVVASDRASSSSPSRPSPSAAPAAPVAAEAAPPPASPAETPPSFADTPGDDALSLELPIPEAGQADREKLESILSDGTARHASDIHLHAGGPLKFRINGEFVVAEEAIASDLVERMVSASLTPAQRQVLSREGELDFCFDLPGVGRFRANAYRQQRGLDAVFRSIPDKPPTLEELGLPEELKKYTDYHQGMVLITGPAGCGKSATMAALVNHINEQRSEHILTVEDPIEIIHPSKNCLVNQRHAGHHTASFARALRGALREDPDVIVIGELRDLETISLAMTAAETGHFVLATL
ncbi:MAG TPA: hypothetical protein ENJ83_00925, partial [Rhodospirillales bacterium]|nr:hypothetical protein [Rhodospirillales bacterium]